MGVIFVAGNLALDYVGTLNERHTTRVEHLRAPTDLADWFVAAGVLDDAPTVNAAEFAEALAFRELAFEVVAQLIDRPTDPVPDARIHRVNAVAAAPGPVPQLDGSGTVRRSGGVQAGLSALARDVLALFELDDDAVLKWCADDACTHPFLDRSRGHRRRWCGMAGCGDRAKAAAYRARRRELGPQGVVEGVA